MRIWSLHPKYLDARGLVALWRETLLAKHVLEGKTKGYVRHPQLNRFRNHQNPLDAVNHYLSEVHKEAEGRGYHFDAEKLNWNFKKSKLTVTKGQINFETRHLLKKLKTRDKTKYKEIKLQIDFDAHPLFIVIDGEIEDWEIR